MKPNIKQLKKWINALYSGEYPQGKGYLQSKNGYCCLGVACMALIPQDQLRFNNGTDLIYGAFPDDQKKSPKWLREINEDFKVKTDKHLSALNDYENFTFTEIATLLELVYIHKILD